jgi:hypothetical protein
MQGWGEAMGALFDIPLGSIYVGIYFYIRETIGATRRIEENRRKNRENFWWQVQVNFPRKIKNQRINKLFIFRLEIH